MTGERVVPTAPGWWWEGRGTDVQPRRVYRHPYTGRLVSPIGNDDLPVESGFVWQSPALPPTEAARLTAERDEAQESARCQRVMSDEVWALLNAAGVPDHIDERHWQQVDEDEYVEAGEYRQIDPAERLTMLAQERDHLTARVAELEADLAAVRNPAAVLAELRVELEEARLEIAARRGMADGALNEHWRFQPEYEDEGGTYPACWLRDGLPCVAIDVDDREIESLRNLMRAIEEVHRG